MDILSYAAYLSYNNTIIDKETIKDFIKNHNSLKFISRKADPEEYIEALLNQVFLLFANTN